MASSFTSIDILHRKKMKKIYGFYFLFHKYFALKKRNKKNKLFLFSPLWIFCIKKGRKKNTNKIYGFYFHFN